MMGFGWRVGSCMSLSTAVLVFLGLGLEHEA